MAAALSGSPGRHRVWAVALSISLLFLPSLALADRTYFIKTYTPYVDEAGESEVALWLTSMSGKQDPAEGATLLPRAEFEHAISSRLTGAVLLNSYSPAGGPLTLESLSLQAVYQLAEPGRLAMDPAGYLQVTESGEELEAYLQLLLARHYKGWIGAVNLKGEFAFRHDEAEHLENGEVLKNEFAGEISGGLAYGVGRRLAVGIEAYARSEHANYGPESAAIVALGPSLNLELGEIQLAVGALRQVSGTPRTSGDLNLENFERTELRVVVSLEL